MHSYLLNGYIKIGTHTFLGTYLEKLKRHLFWWSPEEVGRSSIGHVLHFLIAMCCSLKGDVRIGSGIREL